MRGAAVALTAALLVAGRSRVAAQAAPPDSMLAAACAGGGSMADGLLLVVFRADVSPADRAALARDAGGTLAGDAAAGGQYVTLPPESRAQSDAAADRLIRRDGVQAVGAVSCPPPLPADTAAADSAAPRPPTAPADSLRPTDSTRTR
jgi:hypothetical protein